MVVARARKEPALRDELEGLRRATAKLEKKTTSRKRKAPSADAPTSKNFAFDSTYRPLFHMAYLSANERVAVEMPWLKMMQHFPDMLHRSKYGT